MTITLADAARLRIAPYRPFSRAGIVLLMVAWALLTAVSQLPSQAGLAHSVITEEKPASLPPTCTVIRLAALVTALSWLFVTSATRAPEQATKVRVAPSRAASRYG